MRFYVALFALFAAAPVVAQTSGGVPLVPLTGQRVACTNGTATATMGGQPVSFPCKGVDLMSFLPMASIGGAINVGSSGNASIATTWGWTDPQTGREYAIIGRSDATSFVDVTDPLRPVYVGLMPRPAGIAASSWRELKVLGNVLAVVSEATGHGLQTFDLTQLRRYAGTPITFDATARYTGFGRAHSVLVSGPSGTAVATGMQGTQNINTVNPSAGCASGLHFVTITDPANPAFAGCYSAAPVSTTETRPGYTHDAVCMTYAGPDTRYTGREICFLSNEEVLVVVDATNKSAVVELSRSTHANAKYIHQGWLTQDGRYFYVDDELDEQGGVTGGKTRTIVYDVQDLTRIAPVLEYVGRTAAIDHNQYINGRYDVQSNYTAGINILDLQNPLAPTEAAYFDTYPATDAAQFSGIWNAYPYFRSGVIVAGGINEGLFVLKPTGIALGTTTPEAPAPVIHGVELHLDGANPSAAPVRVRLGLEVAAAARVAVYDVLGHELARLFDGAAPAGTTDLTFDARGLASGVYLVNVRTGTTTLTRRFVVAR